MIRASHGAILPLNMDWGSGYLMSSQFKTDTDAIRAVLQKFLLPFESGDVEVLMEYYTEDAVWMLPDRWPDADKDVARSFYRRAFSRYTFTENAVSIHELEIEGDWAFVRYTATGLMESRESEEVNRRGSRHLTILRRESDGLWRIARDIFNSPPAEFTPP